MSFLHMFQSLFGPVGSLLPADCAVIETSASVVPGTSSLSDPTWSLSKLQCLLLSPGDSGWAPPASPSLGAGQWVTLLWFGWLWEQHNIRHSLEFKLMQNIWAGTNRKEKWKQVVIFHSVGVHFSSHGACPWEQNISNVKSKNIFVVMLGIENNAKTLPSWGKYFTGRL